MGIKNNKNGINTGIYKIGKRDAITDVPGVKVGHVTISKGEINTGVTAILPHEGNLFKEKVVAATYVINGFGKSIGLVQIDELGTIETPIILTNTFSVGTCATGLIKYILEGNSDIGVTTGTVNPVVAECNDGTLNHIRGFHIKEHHVKEAIENAKEDFLEGAVGAGTGMRCYGLKGGIGTASRIVCLDGKEYTLGTLVLSNFGMKRRLTINGINIGEKIKEVENTLDKGSIITILATDIPMNERQLKRLCKRVPAALARTGSYYGNGSGDVVYAFTTANKVNHYEKSAILNINCLSENYIDPIFEVVVEMVEEAVLSSLLHADTTIGINNKAISLREFMDLYLNYKK